MEGKHHVVSAVGRALFISAVAALSFEAMLARSVRKMGEGAGCGADSWHAGHKRGAMGGRCAIGRPHRASPNQPGNDTAEPPERR